MEQLERREVLASGIGAIAGVAFHDQTLDGLTADDIRLENVQVQLYADTNGNGQFDSGTDLTAGGDITDVDGQFRFDGLAGGDYFVVQDTVVGLARPDPVRVDDLDDAGIPLAKIDDYSVTDQSVMASSASPSMESSDIASEAIGNARDIRATYDSGSGSVSLTISSASEDQTFGSMFAVGSVLVQYDGEDGSINLDATGLAGVSLGGGMPGDPVPTGSGFHVESHATSMMDDLVIRVYTDAANYSTYRLAVPVSDTFVEEFVPFRSFTAAQGTGADFNDVGAIEASIDLSGSAAARVAIIETLRPVVQTVNLRNIGQLNLGPTDLQIAKTAGATQISEGDTIRYSMVVTNNGPGDVVGATVTDSFPAELTDVTWNAVVTHGTGAVTASGMGDINETIDLASGSEITFTVAANVVRSLTAHQPAAKIVTNSAHVDYPGDTDPSNNTSTDSDVVVLAVRNSTSGAFVPGNSLGAFNSVNVALGDLDGDGDLDAFVANNTGPGGEGEANRVWINDGSGDFTDTQQALGDWQSRDVSLGDLDGDGDLDAFVANNLEYGFGGEANRVWINDGGGNFTTHGQGLGNSRSLDVSLGDLDGDGDLDAFVANNGSNEVWLNDGNGTFTDSGNRLGDSGSTCVGLGDLDGDGDLDALVTNRPLFTGQARANRVWLNDGQAMFRDSNQLLGDSQSDGVSLGDADGDGDLDAFVVDYIGQNSVWINDGNGGFADRGESLGDSSSRDVSLGDLDGDGDLDAFVVNSQQQPRHRLANRVWLNGGDGTFTDSGSMLGNSFSEGVSLGDLDGDGDLDAFIASFGANQVWLNGSADLQISKTASATQVREGDPISYTIVVTNHGPSDISGAMVTDTFPTELTDVTWAASLQGTGAVSANGIGDINEVIDLAAGSEITFSVTANVVGSLAAHQPAAKIVTNAARVEHPDDIDRSNNGATDGDIVVLAISNPTHGLFAPGSGVGDSLSLEVRLGDLDGDGDLDAFVANAQEDPVTGEVIGAPNRVWLNDGNGNFREKDNGLGDSISFGLELGDLDGDGDLDAFVANAVNLDGATGAIVGRPNRVWLSDGSGNFSESGSGLGNSASLGVALGDLDGDGDLDAFVANALGENVTDVGPNRVWLNDGAGGLTDSQQELGNSISRDVKLGDLDGDGDLDAFVANGGLSSGEDANSVWLNDGNGRFTDSRNRLGDSHSEGVSLGDLDGDDDLDAFVTNDGPNRVWLNRGNGMFEDSNQLLGNSEGQSVNLADLDGDGDLDAFVANRGDNLDDPDEHPNRVWLNDGSGNFTESSGRLGDSLSRGVSLGDLDGDGDIDAFVANTSPNQVWLNAFADLRIRKTASPDPVTAGTGQTYTIEVTNDGPDEASGVVVTDALPVGVTFVSGDVDGASGAVSFDSASNTVTGDVGVLASAAASTVTITVEVAADAIGPLSNTATVTATPNTDPDFDNNHSRDDSTVDRIADLTITKAVDRTADAQPGTLLTYTVTVTNSGPSQATGVEAVDTLPGGVTFVSGSGSGGEDLTETGGQVIVDGGTLDPGDDFTFTIIVTVASGASGTLENRVTVDSDVTDNDTNNNVATASTTVDPVNSQIAGIVFADLNANGMWDAGDYGIGDVMLTLVGMDARGNTVSRDAMTDSNGEYVFGGLPAGTYDVIQTQPHQYRNGQLEPGSGAIATIGENEFIDLALAADTSATGWNFGELAARFSKRRFLASS